MGMRFFDRLVNSFGKDTKENNSLKLTHDEHKISYNNPQYGSLTELHDVCEDDDNPELVQRLIDNGADVNSVDCDGETPLYDACYYQNLENVRTLIAAGANVNARTQNLTTCLMVACDNADYDIAEILLKAGADINAQDIEKNSALTKAVCYDNLDLVDLLLRKGADLKVRCSGFYTPLHEACDSKNAPMVKLLINAGADIEARNKYGDTPLMTAIKSLDDGKDDVDGTNTIKTLISFGADVNCKNLRGDSPLNIAADGDNMAAVNELILSKAYLDTTDKDQQTPLMNACKNGYARIVKALLEAGADVHLKNASGQTVFDMAEDEKIKKLLSKIR